MEEYALNQSNRMSLFFTPPFQIEAMDERTTRSSTHKGAEALAEAVAEVFPLTCPSVSPPSGPPVEGVIE